MDSAWSRAEEILDRLLDEEADRAPALDTMHPALDALRSALEGEPESVRREVESLLPHLFSDGVLAGRNVAESMPRLLGGLAQDAAPEDHVQRDRFVAGDQLGAYRLIAEIGRGGMGVVFLAERADHQFEKRVALKVVNGPVLGMEAERRFLRERQILAELEHPAIARLLDGGVASDGSPFLVMDLVDGEPIDVYCDRTGARLEQRLELFLAVCDAVRSAHERLIVHRDIKPPNVLVTDEGQVKLLDFGIAGLVEEAEAAPVSTIMHAFTPEYASPEQVRLERVGAASDVYSLGMLLYLLLARRLPYQTRGLRPAELEQLVCEVEPEPPSVALIGGEDAEPGRSRLRLARRLRGDLDHIVLKALEKGTSRRYPSATELALDVRRHLRGLPVEARPATVGYRARRFVARHRLAVAASGAIVLAMMMGLAVAASQALRASRERDLAQSSAAKARVVSEFLTELFEEANPYEGADPTASDLLATGEAKIATELGAHPEARADLLEAMGRAYQGLGNYEAAQRLGGEALELKRRLLPETSPELGRAILAYGLSLAAAGQSERAVALMHEALGLLEADGSDGGEAGARAHRSLANHAVQNDLALAEHHLQRALEIQRRITPGESTPLGLLIHDLARLWELQGRHLEGLELKREALAMIEPLVEPGAPVLYQIQGNLAISLAGLGRFEEADGLHRAAIAGLEARLAPNHPGLIASLTSHGHLLLTAGRFEDAAQPIERSAALAEGLVEPRYDAVGARVNLATLRREQGRLTEALELYESALDALSALGLADRSAPVARVESLIGESLIRLGRLPEARDRLRHALAIQEEQPGVQVAVIAESQAALGEALCRLGTVDDGLELIDRGCAGSIERASEHGWQAGTCAVRRAECALRAGRVGPTLVASLESAQRSFSDRLPAGHYWRTRVEALRAEVLPPGLTHPSTGAR